MSENYKHLYEQTRKMLAMYQDELVPGFRKHIEKLEKNKIEVRCKDCKYRKKKVCANPSAGMWVGVELRENDYCSYGERKNDG